jgi:hypothetical protein
MADNGFKDGVQFPFPTNVEEGTSYNREIKARANAILSTLMGFRPSNYQSNIPSTNYSKFLRAMSLQLAKLTFELERLADDISFEEVRSEFLQTTIGELVLINDQTPETSFNDEEFRSFLLKIIDIYFQGATPESMRGAVMLFAEDDFDINELFREKDISSLDLSDERDLSDQFGFQISFDRDDSFPDDHFDIQSNIRLLLRLVKPAHTLYEAKNVFADLYNTSDRIEAQSREGVFDQRYEDVRSYWQGMSGFSSKQGEIKDGMYRRLFDMSSVPIDKVRTGASLKVKEGVNAGMYRVEEVHEHSLTIHPPFDRAEENVSYHVEVDRKGRMQATSVEEEDVSHLFRPPDSLDVDGQGPYTVLAGDTIQVSATSNYSKVAYSWDITGNGVFDIQGQSIQIDTSRYQQEVVDISVKGVSTLYGVSVNELDGDESPFYQPDARDIDRVRIYLV